MSESKTADVTEKDVENQVVDVDTSPTSDDATQDDKAVDESGLTEETLDEGIIVPHLDTSRLQKSPASTDAVEAPKSTNGETKRQTVSLSQRRLVPNCSVSTDEDALAPASHPTTKKLKWTGTSTAAVDIAVMREKYEQFLEKSQVFKSLSKEGQDFLLANAVVKDFRRNEIVLRQGEVAGSMVILLDGEVTVNVQKRNLAAGAHGTLARGGTMTIGSNDEFTPRSTPRISPRHTPRGTPRGVNRRASSSVTKISMLRNRRNSIDVDEGGEPREAYGHIARTCTTGEIFGESSLVKEDVVRAATLICVSDTAQCLIVDKSSVVLAMVNENTPVSPDGLPQVDVVDDSESVPDTTCDPKRLEEIQDRIAAYFGDSTIDDAFNVMDDDGNQYLDYREFRSLIRDKARVPITEEEFKRLMNVYDENQDGVISLTEFKLKYRIKRTEFLQFIELKEDEADRFGSLPAIVLFFVVYVVLCNFRENTALMWQQSQFLSSQFVETATFTSGITYPDIVSVADVIEWVDEVLIPTVFTLDQPWEHGDASS